MDPQKPKLPPEAVQLYNIFIHGGMSRRDFMDGIQKLAVGGLVASAMVEALMPNYAQGQQVARNDDRIKASYQTVPSPQGNGSIKGYFVRPVSADTRDAKHEEGITFMDVLNHVHFLSFIFTLCMNVPLLTNWLAQSWSRTGA